jgi:hypothetical protein
MRVPAIVAVEIPAAPAVAAAAPYDPVRHGAVAAFRGKGSAHGGER